MNIPFARDRRTAGYVDTLARCYYRKGDFAKAVELQKKAAELLPYYQQIQRQLRTFEEALERSQEPVDGNSDIDASAEESGDPVPVEIE